MRLALRDRSVDLERGRPLIMGILNGGPDSFSDPAPEARDHGALAEAGLAMVEQGAAIVDVGGESGRTDRPAVSEDEETERIEAVVARLADAGVAVSVDTWRLGPARAALAAGAAMVNDVSGLADPALAKLCAGEGAALVVTHTRASPKQKSFPGYEDLVSEVAAFLGARLKQAEEIGVRRDALVADPGVDLAKTPAQSVELLCRLPELAPLARPLLLAVSRKDFVGALTGRPPAARGPGTLAALEPALDCEGALVRVHDVAAARDFLTVRGALRGEAEPPGALDPALRAEAIA